MLESLGLDTAAEQLYREMLAHPGEGLATLCERLGLDLSDARSILDRLSALALVRPDQNGSFAALSPEYAIELILARQRAELASHQLRVAETTAAAARLIEECSTLPLQPTPGDTSEHLLGLESIRARLADLSAGAESEIMTFAPGGAHSSADLSASRAPNAALIDRGVRMRTVYLNSVSNDPATLAHVSWLHENGAQVRMAPSLPVRMVIFDRRRVVLPLDSDDSRTAATVLVAPGLVTALVALFNEVWASAVPFGTTERRDDRGLSRQESEVLHLLARGSTDEAIAHRLGVSPRTARRLTADLMRRLDARSRFQAGVYAVQDGWLPLTR